MESGTGKLPLILRLFPKLKPPNKTFVFHQIVILIVTFIAYASFHASRKPPSIVKSVLGPTVHSNLSVSGLKQGSIDTGWAPFNGSEGTHRLGELDLAFLASYSIGMYFAGHVGDRIDLRSFLVFGMTGSGIFTAAFGLGFWLNLHFLGYYLIVQIFSGLFQSIGWPCVVAVVGNWCGKDKRGLIMGVWTSHTSVGNIIGSVVASGMLEFGWGWSFLLPGVLIILAGALVCMCLVVHPQDLGFDEPGKETEMTIQAKDTDILETVESEEAGLLEKHESNGSLSAIGFFEAWRIPSVAQYAICLFFSKLVAYTFLYWLPFYIRHTAVAGVHLSHKAAGTLSSIFDIGGVVGGVLAGYISDKIEARATTSLAFLLLSIPALIFYRVYGEVSMFTNVAMMFISGLLVNGPYSLITTAVAADLGTEGNSRALATVSAIIDGTGSVGAALGPLLAGYMSTRGWNSVFAMLIFSIFFASLCLVRLGVSEVREKLTSGKWAFLGFFFREGIPS